MHKVLGILRIMVEEGEGKGKYPGAQQNNKSVQGNKRGKTNVVNIL